MTKKQLESLQKAEEHLTVRQALELAFEAGCSYSMGSHGGFEQLHETKVPVCAVLEECVDTVPRAQK